MKISLAVLLVALALAASSQSDCPVSVTLPVWAPSVEPSTATVGCNGAAGGSNLKWWAVADPCLADPATATAVEECSGDSCTVDSLVYSALPSCSICCTDTTMDTSFMMSAIISCTEVKLCPSVESRAPLLAKTGSRVDVQTYITTKPQLPRGRVTVTAIHLIANGTAPLEVVGEGAVYPVPGNSNMYAVIHTIQMPKRNPSVDDRVVYTVNTSTVPRGPFCTSQDTLTHSIDLIEVEDPETSTPPSETTACTAAGGSTAGVSPTGSGLSPTAVFSLDVQSLAIGVSIGVVGTMAIVLVVVVVLVVVRCAGRAQKSTDTSSHHHSSNGGERPLLTINGTPATTPSSDGQHSLGHASGQTSDSTPASTPTEMQDLLLTQQSQTSDSSPYEEIRGTHLVREGGAFTALHSNRPPPPPTNRPAPPPPAFTAPPTETAPHSNIPPPPPKNRPVPPLPGSLVPRPPRMGHAEHSSSILQSSAPGYFTQDDVAKVYLSRSRNNGEIVV